MAAAASPPQDQRQRPPRPEEGAGAREEPAALTPRRARFPRACHNRSMAAAPAPPPAPASPPRPRPRRGGNAGDETPEYRVVTPLVAEPEAPGELPRWRLRGMWELASVLNFLHVFRPLLNIAGEFTAEELEDAIITPNATLDDVHMPLLKSIPPHWWHWVAEGDLPVVASHGAEVEMYRTLEPATRLVILKAICDIRCEQEDVRNFIDSSLKHGYHLPIFRKERIGGDSHGISYWYEDDPILGHRLYREIRRVEYVKEPTKKSKGKGVSSVPVISYKWEAVASNFDEFKVAAEKLFSSRNRTEVSLGKKLNNNYLPEIEKIHKKAHDYDRSINEAIKTTKKSENAVGAVSATNRRVRDPAEEALGRGRLPGPSPLCNGFDGESPTKSYWYQMSNGEEKAGTLQRRQRKRSQRYSKDFVEALSDMDTSFDSDDDIMGEAVYDEEYLRSRKQHKASVSDNGDEFQLEQVVGDGDDGEHFLSASEDAEECQRHKRLPTRNPRVTKFDEIQISIRRSKRSTRPRIKYQQYDISGTDTEFGKPDKCNVSDPDAGSDALNDMEPSTSRDQEEEDDEVNKVQQQQQQQHLEESLVPIRENKSAQRKFLDLNELAPVGGYDDVRVLVKDERMHNG
ncbi:hypothetical protein ACP4OV_007979 [Aristida adscensionis]